MKLHLPWQKVQPSPAPPAASLERCSHPRVEVEMHGTAIKRRWCAVCGQALPLAAQPLPDD